MPLPPDVGSAFAFRSGSESLFQLLRSFASLGAAQPTAVALPAYSCPSVLGAVLGAGLTPYFVDLASQSFSLDVDSLRDALDRGASALVAVDLFGVPSLTAETTAACRDAGVFVIRDMAQCKLADVAARPMGADAGVLSFGRGKPTSLLFGGALLLPPGSPLAAEMPPVPAAAAALPLVLALRAAAYNLATQPLAYALVRNLPGLHIGESRLEITTRAVRLSAAFLELVARQSEAAELARDVDAAAGAALLAALDGSALRVPEAAREACRGAMLSRLPALAADATMATAVEARAANYGVTTMYRRCLPEFHGLAAPEVAARWPNAYSLARTLLTFPCTSALPHDALRALAARLPRLRN